MQIRKITVKERCTVNLIFFCCCSVRSFRRFIPSISIQKDLLQDNHASIILSVTSPFKKYRRSYSELNDPEFYLLQQSYFIVRRFNLSYNYRFGKLEDDITRKKRGIKNDDLKTGEQQSGKN